LGTRDELKRQVSAVTAYDPRSPFQHGTAI
jgi:hypothetical protein